VIVVAVVPLVGDELGIRSEVMLPPAAIAGSAVAIARNSAASMAPTDGRATKRHVCRICRAR